MSLFRAPSKSTVRPSLKITLKLVNRKGSPLDEGEAWQALVDAFRKHPELDVYQATIGPDTDENN